MAAVFTGVIGRLTELYTASASMPYGAAGNDLPVDPLSMGDGRVGFLAHALQCALNAAEAHPADVELRVAALLHDVGWLLPHDAPMLALRVQEGGGAARSREASLARHDLSGAFFLSSLGFAPRVCRLVAGHVQAKRYLVAAEPAYGATLSEGSRHTLRLQGGPMSAEEVAAFEAEDDFSLICALRRWDEAAKVPGRVVPGWASYASDMETVLASHLFRSFSEQLEGGALCKATVLPARGSAALPYQQALGPDGPGYVLVRGWLSAAEIAAVQQYAREYVPSLPDALVHHTYERRGLPANGEGKEWEGEVVPSRTEFFAHVSDGDVSGIGARLLLARTPAGAHSRLAELCATLRGGRPQVLYKEKVNYKLANGTGGYSAHQDFYHNFASTGERTTLIPDGDVCVCMLAVDNIDDGNGCPQVAPGWHTRGPMSFGAGCAVNGGHPVVDEAALPWTSVLLAPGDVLIYGNLMPHKSGPNSSDRDRRALFSIYADEEKAGSRVRDLYYSFEGANRRARGSAADQGRSNMFFTGAPVLRVGGA
jgi:predicted HD phosphohydrolase/ectoine hydroxylase-related dioxygenase (phytanoyl-CoA dioxygenase family)